MFPDRLRRVAGKKSVAAPGGLIALLAVLALGACGGGVRTPASAHPPRSAPAGEWAVTSWEAKHDTMTFAVLPNMARLFQQFDGSASPATTCRTCHGADAEDVQYEMPHGLPALDPTHLPDPRNPGRSRVERFMAEEVTPQMAELLGVDVYDPATGRGFSCFNCHPSTRGPR